jgi:AcrR family transcriptional regulator
MVTAKKAEGVKGPSRVARKLLDAAMVCFAADGYHGGTTKAICKRAGCTEGSLFRLFGSKDKLFEAVLSKAFQELSRDDFAQVVGVFDHIASPSFRVAAFGCLERTTTARAMFLRENGLVRSSP